MSDNDDEELDRSAKMAKIKAMAKKLQARRLKLRALNVRHVWSNVMSDAQQTKYKESMLLANSALESQIRMMTAKGRVAFLNKMLKETAYEVFPELVPHTDDVEADLRQYKRSKLVWPGSTFGLRAHKWPRVCLLLFGKDSHGEPTFLAGWDDSKCAPRPALTALTACVRVRVPAARAARAAIRGSLP